MSQETPMNEGMPSWTQLVAKVALVALVLILITQAGMKGLLVAGIIFGMYIFIRAIDQRVAATPQERVDQREQRREERRKRYEERQARFSDQEADTQDAETHDIDFGKLFNWRASRREKQEARRLKKQLERMSADEFSAIAAQELFGDDDGSDEGPPVGV